jgi:hypothetical protein
MSFIADTATSAFQKAIYDFGKFAVSGLFVWLVSPWLSKQAAAMNVPGVVAWGIVIAAFLVFVGLWFFDWFVARKNIQRRRVRSLEYHAMHLSWIRDKLIDPNASTQLVSYGDHVVEKHRSLLIDQAPDVFPQSVATRFASATMLVPGPDEDARARIIERVDYLLDRVKSAWLQFDGVNTPGP